MKPKKEVFVMKRTLLMLFVFIGAMLFVDGDSVPLVLPFVFAHCDTLDGPVVKTARVALEKGEVTPILKWVKKENESEITDLFKNKEICNLSTWKYAIPYLTSTSAPASCNCFCNACASSLLTPSFTALGAASTSSLASFKPKLVSSFTNLTTASFA